MKKLLLLTILSIILFGCKKEEDVNVLKSLSGKSWLLKERILEDGFNDFGPIEVDDTYTFTETSLTINYGANEPDRKPKTFPATFTDNKIMLTNDYPYELYYENKLHHFEVVSWSETEIKLKPFYKMKTDGRISNLSVSYETLTRL